jgi:hypothetical protein
MDIRSDVQYLSQSQEKYVDSSTINAAFNIEPALTFSFPYVVIHCYAGGGLCNTWLTCSSLSGVSDSKTSLDPSAVADL